MRAPAPDLADVYEQLRCDAVGAAAAAIRSVRGLAILLRQGMAAWIHACSAVTSSAAASPPVAADDMCMPASVQREVIDVLAAMASATAWEVRA